MLISIVIPARNEERYLPDCLKSIKEQSYKGDLEIILVDNGSTDNTAAIARSFGITVIPATAQKSVFYARQVGADAAKGDIIVQADADTIYPAHWLQRLADKLAGHPKASAISGRFFYRDKFTWAFVELFVRNILNLVYTAIFGFPFLVSGATFAFRRNAFIAAGGYHGLAYSADQYGIARRLRKYGKVLYDPRLYIYTSSRTVHKSGPRLLWDVGGNLYRLVKYWVDIPSTHPNAARLRKLRKGLTWTISAMVALIIGFSAYGYFVPAAPVFGKIYNKGPGSEKVVALTFDDGPNEPYTSQILDILKENNIHATFFVIGENAEKYPDVARRIIADGNVIGNHSFSHNPDHALNDYASKDLGLGEQAIYQVTGVLPHLYRPPFGKKTPWELHNVKADSMIEITWSTTANDQHVLAYFGKPKPDGYAKAITNHVHPGSIILMHDGYGLIHNVTKSDKSLAVEALPIIIAQLKAKGYRFVTVPEMLGVNAYNTAK